MVSDAGIQALLNNPKLSPREKVRLRAQLEAVTGKTVNLHLGSPTPEVIKQLEFQKSIQRDPIKQKDLEAQIKALNQRGVVMGNSSTRPAESRESALRTFQQQKAVTKQVGEQVRLVLESPEVQASKQAGGGIEFVNQELNRKGIAFPTFQREIINELAQVDIQGKTQTEENISRILDRSGIINSQISLTPKGTLESGNSSSEILNPLFERINGLIEGVPNIDQPFLQGDPEFIPPEDQPAGILDKLISLLSNPLVAIIAFIGFIILVLGVSSAGKRMVITR